MAVDEEVLGALHQAIKDAGQTDALEKSMAAWLKAMSENELGHSDNKRHLEAAKHAVQLPIET